MNKYALLFILIPAISSAINLDSLLIRSVGGTEAVAKLARVRSIVTTGSVSLGGQTGHFEQYFQVPDKFYLKVEFELFSIVQAYDGSVAWQTNLTGKTTTLVGFEKRELLKTVYQESFSYLFPGRVAGAPTYLGHQELDIGLFHKVAFVTSAIDTVFVLYSEASGLKRFMKTRLDNLEVTTEISDYRKVSGVSLPYYSRTETVEAGILAEFVVSEVSFNQEIAPRLFVKPQPETGSFSFPDSLSYLTIPIDYSGGHIRLLVSVNGQRLAWFILDSGASISIFHKPFARELGLNSAGSLPFKGLSGYEEAGMFRVDSLSIGALTLRDQVCGLLDLKGLAKAGPDGIGFGGLLGYNFLSQFPIMIDYQESRLTVFHPDRFQTPDGGVEAQFELIMQVPSIRAILAGIPGNFLVDLGNPFGLMLHHRFVNEAGLIDSLSMIEEFGEGIGGVGGSLSGQTALAGRFQIGKIIIDSLQVILPDSAYGMAGSKELAGNIGNKVLENFTLLFDYAGQRIIFYPADEPIPVN